MLKYFIVFGILLVAVGLASGAYFFWPREEEKPICQEGQITASCICGQETKETGFCCKNFWLDADCSVTNPPSPIFSSINKLATIDVQQANFSKITSDIKKAAKNIPAGDIRIIALKNGASPNRYATLEQFQALFGLSLPPQISQDNLSYNLLLFVKPTTATSSTDYDVRLGLALEQKQETQPETLAIWEDTMINDLEPLYLDLNISSSTQAKFSDSLRQGKGRHRFVNFDSTNLSLDYAVSDKKLIFTTSKWSIDQVLDLISEP